MEFFSGGLFWLIEGILLCLVILGFNVWLEDSNIRLNIWKWILILFWIVLFGFTIAFIFTSLGENETTAAIKGGMMFGFIVVLSGAFLWRFLKLGLKTDV